MNGDALDRILSLDPKQLIITVTGALRDPSSNVPVFVLLVSGIVVIVALVVVLLVAAFLMGEDEEDEYGEATETGEARGATPARATPVPVAPAPLTPRQRVISGVLWAVAFAVVLVVGGSVSSRDAICTSCHLEGAVHVARYEDPKADPHASTDCVSCHETPNKVASMTLAVPGRAVHMIGGLVWPKAVVGYGVPVANRACNGCHSAQIATVVEDERRGLRMSHKEPLAENALCSDCHAQHPDSGVTDRFTVGMDPCLRCHNEEAASAECDYCHTKDVGYAVQASVSVKPRKQIVDVDCGGCHDQGPCDACHGIRMPHTKAFKTVQHARPGVEDIWFNGGKRCSRCHLPTRNPCFKCHLSSFPGHPVDYMIRTHKITDPYNNGCGNCHDNRAWIQGRNFCGVCHAEYEPSALSKTTER